MTPLFSFSRQCYETWRPGDRVKTEVEEEPVAVKTDMKKEAAKFSVYFSEDESDEDFQPTKRKKVKKHLARCRS